MCRVLIIAAKSVVRPTSVGLEPAQAVVNTLKAPDSTSVKSKGMSIGID